VPHDIELGRWEAARGDDGKLVNNPDICCRPELLEEQSISCAPHSPTKCLGDLAVDLRVGSLQRENFLS